MKEILLRNDLITSPQTWLKAFASFFLQRTFCGKIGYDKKKKAKEY